MRWLRIAASAARQVGVLDAKLRAAAAALQPALDAADAPAPDPLDPAVLRLNANKVCCRPHRWYTPLIRE
jgi:hypothetical protein